MSVHDLTQRSESVDDSPPFATPADQVLKRLGVDLERGLIDAQVSEQSSRPGENQLAEAPSTPLRQKLLGLFSNPHLFGAIVISGLLQLSVVTSPFAQPVFEVSSHPTWEWLMVFLLALTPVTIIEVGKLLRALFQKARADACPGNAS